MESPLAPKHALIHNTDGRVPVRQVAWRASREKPLTANCGILGLAIVSCLALINVPDMQPFVRMFGYTPYRAFYLGWVKLTSPVQASIFGVITFSAFVLMFAMSQTVLLQPGAEALSSRLIAIVLFAALCFARASHIAPLGFVATISYSLYVSHVPLGSFLLDWLTLKAHVAYEVALPLVIAALLGLSWASCHALETPTQWLGRRLIKTFQLARAPSAQTRPGLAPPAP